ncbi:MAG: hypothetical protein J6P31_02905 [Oscillospiraceae bacterium]|nr:hypothetical protein [Oscillospiraceae bacterium]
MRDPEIIQYPGFRNIYDDAGNAIGFEFRIRTNYYRGVYLSLLHVGRVTVDGEEFLPNSGAVTWIIGGKEFTPAEMAEDNVTHWPVTETATIRVKKPGGLAQGYHDVWLRWGHRASYMPPSMTVFNDDSTELGRSGDFLSKRTMLMV